MEKIKYLASSASGFNFLKVMIEFCLDEAHEMNFIDAAAHLDRALVALVIQGPKSPAGESRIAEMVKNIEQRLHSG